MKLAPVVLAARTRDDVALRLVSSGQHPRPMLEVLDHFGLDVDADIGCFADGRTLTETTAAALDGFNRVLEAERPDVVVVHGDTTTAFAGALAAFYHQIPVAHVEAGLRTHVRYEPFPEEMNRRLIDALATFLFPPTPTAAWHLLVEGNAAGDMFTTGNTIVDALRSLLAQPPAQLSGAAAAFADGGRWRRRILVTAHRRESWGPPLDEVAAALAGLALRLPEDVFLLPAHPNPIVRRSFLAHELPRNVLLVEPLPYPQFIGALAAADVVVTDSGGVVEEAAALGVPALILRERTERPEAVAAGAARVVGLRREAIEQAVVAAVATRRNGGPGGVDVFGDGCAAERIVAWLRWRYGLAEQPPEAFGAEPAEPTALPLSVA